MIPEERGPLPRIDLNSIAADRIGLALAIFVTAVAVISAIDALLFIYNHNPETWQLAAEDVLDDGSAVVGWAFVATLVITEAPKVVIGTIMLITQERRRREAEEQARKKGLSEGRAEGRTEGLKEGRTEGRKEGIEETQRLWEAWLERRRQAEERGETFNESPPGADGGDVS